MKIKIFSTVYNRPDILQYQIDCLKKFIINDFELHVVYDSRDEIYYDEFKKICDKNFAYFHYHKSSLGHSPSFYHAQALEWISKENIFNTKEDSIIMILDHDMFLIEEFDLLAEIADYDVMGLLQERGNVEYFWPGLCIFKKSSIENIEFDFYPQMVNGYFLDTGGGTYKILNNENIKFYDTGVEYPEQYYDINLTDETVTNGFNYELHFNGKFLHFRNASNWHTDFKIIDEKKTNILYRIIEDIL